MKTGSLTRAVFGHRQLGLVHSWRRRVPGWGAMFALLLSAALEARADSLPNLTFYTPAGWSDSLLATANQNPLAPVTNFYPSDVVTVYLGITNSGTAPAPSNWQFTIQVDGALVATKNYLSGLDAGSVDTQSYGIGQLSAGTHSIKLTLDSSNKTLESSETDNSATTIVNILPGTPNLSFYQNTFPPNIWSAPAVIGTAPNTISNTVTDFLPSDLLYLNWAVLNNGTGLANSNWYATVYIDGTNYNSYLYGSPLKPTYWWSRGGCLGRFTPGTHVITTVLDVTNILAESDETDNAYTNVIHVGAGQPNLTFCTPPGWGDSIVIANAPGITNHAPTSILPSDTNWVAWAVTNNGTGFAPSNWVTSIYVDNARVGTYTYPSAIPPTGYSWIWYPLGQLSQGDHSVRIVLDSGNSVDESNSADNSDNRTVTISGGSPNLTFFAPPGWSDSLVVGTAFSVTNSTSSIFTPADTIYVTWAVQNNGTGAAPSGWGAAVKLDGVTQATVGCDSLLNPMGAWAQTHIIGRLPTGKHVISVALDSSLIVAESDETDNLKSSTISIVAGNADLAFKEPPGWSNAVIVASAPGVTNFDEVVFNPADTIYLNWGVGNVGTATAAANWYTAIHIDGINADVHKCGVAIPALATWTVTDHAIGRLAEGVHTIELLLDSTSIIPEMSNTNNTFVKTITVSSGVPNLAFSKLPNWSAPVVIAASAGATNSLSTNFLTTDDLYVNWAVTNNGTGPANGSWTASINVDGVTLGTYQSDSILDALAGRNVESALQSRLTPGQHTVTVVLDSTSAIAEKDENDNTYSIAIFVTQPQAPVATLADGTDSPWLTWLTGGEVPWVVDTQTSHALPANSARSGVLYGGQSSWLETTVTGPGFLSFWTKEQGANGTLTFSINQIEKQTFSGEFDWQLHRYEIPADTQQLRWTYSKSPDADTNGAAWLDQISFTSSPGITPIIVKQPLGGTISLGGTAGFTVDVSSGSGLTYQWRKNGTNLVNGHRMSGATTPFLTITNVAATDAGNYSVLVKSPFGSSTSVTATLNVIGQPPVILTQLINADRSVGDRAVFRVVAAGNAPLSYRWMKDGTNLVASTRITGVTNSTLTLTNLVLDSGAYWVVISNAYGSVESDHATLHVLNVIALWPPSVITEPADKTVAPGTSAFFSIDALGAGLSYQWSRNGSKIGDNSRITGSKTPMLVISNVMSADAGAYSVIVSNSHGFFVSSNATLRVAGQSPVILESPLTLSKHAGTSATLYATARGTAPFSYFWRKNQTNLVSSSRIVGGVTNASLTLTNLQPADAGAYSVVVSNAWGFTNNLVATLAILPNAPVITGNPRSATNKVGSIAVLTVTNAPGGPLSIQWYKDGTRLMSGGKITGANTNRLTVTNLFFSDAGIYVAVITNSAGMAISAPATLTILPETILPTLKIVQPAPGGTVSATSRWITITGTAKDNAGVSNIWVRINNGPWNQTPGINKGTSWSVTLAAVPGANTIEAFSQDICANRSISVIQKFTFVPLSALTIRTSGSGIIRGVTNSQLLAIGKPFTARAIPTTGNHFTRWTTNLPGGADLLAGTSATLATLMSSNLEIKAWFAAITETPAPGTYQGLFFDNTPQQSANSGFLTMTFRESGAFSASLKQSGSVSGFTGQWGEAGYWSTKAVAGANAGLTLRYDSATGEIVGTVNGNGWTGDLRAEFIQANPALAGTYNVTLAPSGPGAIPQWVTLCSLTVNPSGAAVLSVGSASPVAISGFSGLSADGWWPFYQPLAPYSGTAIGWLQFTNGPATSNELRGTLFLTK